MESPRDLSKPEMTAVDRESNLVNPSRMKPRLFSIHGIRTAGEWQKGAAAVLEPFYDYYSIKYTQFQEWAILKLGLDLLTLFLFIIAAALLVRYGLLRGLTSWAIIVVAATIAFLLAHFYAERLRDTVIEHTYTEMSKNVNEPAPYVVAHSLGTYITCKVLQTFEEWGYHTIILMGCVVARKFPWLAMSGRFEWVSNEASTRDWVPYAACLLGWSGMGCSGSRGFKGEIDRIHNVNPGQAYPNCGENRCLCNLHPRSEPCLARIHNVRHKRLKHSKYFVGLNHAWQFWLPTLWGYDPVLYREFREACQKCHRLETEDAPRDKQDTAAHKLRSTCWGWTQGTLEEFTKDQIGKEEPTLSRDLIPLCTDLTIATLWHNFSLAAQESTKLEGRDQALMEQLEPRIALKRAIRATLDKIQQSEHNP